MRQNFPFPGHGRTVKTIWDEGKSGANSCTTKARKFQILLESIIKNSLAETSQAAYNNNWSSFKKFVKLELGSKPLPAAADDVSLFVIFLHTMQLCASSIQNYLSAIGFVHKLYDYPDPTKSFKVQKVKDAIKNLGGPKRQRSAIRAKLLGEIVHVLPIILQDAYDQILFTCVFLLMYHACLRISEIANTAKCKHALLSHNIYEKKHSVRLKLLSFKHSGNPVSRMIIPATNDMLCPNKAVGAYRAVRGSIPGVFFIKKNDKPISRAQVVSVLKRALELTGRDGGNYNTHSLRKGKITDSAAAGASDSQLRLIGRFKSNAFLKYIEPKRVNTRI